ncbi:MAG: hypothetical protein ACQESF_05055 [Nanobdellota archaeon]
MQGLDSEFDYRRVRHYIRKNSDFLYTEEKIHDNLVDYVMSRLGKMWPDSEFLRGVKLKNLDGFCHGRPDLVALDESLLRVIEVKVIRKGNSRYEKQMIRKRERQSLDQLLPYFNYFKKEFGIEPNCYLAIKHKNKSSGFSLKHIPIKYYMEFKPECLPYNYKDCLGRSLEYIN